MPKREIQPLRIELEAARRQGRVGGRKRQMAYNKIQAARKLLASGTPPREVAHNLTVSIPTFYRLVPALRGREGLAIAVGRFPDGSVSIR
jgi:DNA invertase Pin-like site-specific DNA recombinase